MSANFGEDSHMGSVCSAGRSWEATKSLWASLWVVALSDRAGLFGGIHKIAYVKALCETANTSLL